MTDSSRSLISQDTIDRGAIAAAVADLFSPLTEIAGAIGDQVRVYRELNLKRSLARAKKTAEEEGIELSPPPLKFLVPYMEQCSLEPDDDEELASMWTNLLVSSATKYESEHNLFLRILGEMTSNEAKALQYLVRSEAHEDYESRQFIGEVESDWRDSYLYIAIRDIIQQREEQPSSEQDFAEIEEQLRIERQTPGSIISYFSVSKGVKNEFPYENAFDGGRTRIDDDFNSISFAMLKSLGLINFYQSSELWFPPYCFELHTWYVTELGARFYQCCTLTDGWIEGGNSKHGTTPNAKFEVAFSFPGEHRSLIEGIAECLAERYGRPRVFYDEYHQALLARPNLDVFLQDIYRSKSRLLVVLLCEEYQQKEWCGIEWRAIRDIMKCKADSQIMFLKSGNPDVEGVFSIDGYIDVANHSEATIASMIQERVAGLRQS